MVTDGGQIVEHVGSKVTQSNKRFAALVFNLDTRHCRVMGNEHFVVSFLSESNHDGCLKVELSDSPTALNGNPAATHPGLAACIWHRAGA